jgi:hypothetical protein
MRYDPDAFDEFDDYEPEDEHDPNNWPHPNRP